MPPAWAAPAVRCRMADQTNGTTGARPCASAWPTTSGARPAARTRCRTSTPRPSSSSGCSTASASTWCGSASTTSWRTGTCRASCPSPAPPPPSPSGCGSPPTSRWRPSTTRSAWPRTWPCSISSRAAGWSSGLGLGYAPHEFRAFGIPISRRVSLTEECADILRLAWSGERFSYAGKRYQFDDVLVTPAPVQPGGPPLWTATTSPQERRPGRALRHPRPAAGRARARARPVAGEVAGGWARPRRATASASSVACS